LEYPQHHHYQSLTLLLLSLLPETHHQNQLAAGTATKPPPKSHAVTPTHKFIYINLNLGIGSSYLIRCTPKRGQPTLYHPPLDEIGEAVARQARHTFVHLGTTFADRWTPDLIVSQYLGRSRTPLDDFGII